MIRLALFDMDGTIFHSNLNWSEIRRVLGIEEGRNILKEIFGKTDTESRRRYHILEQYERENTFQAKPRRGLKKFLRFLDDHHIRKALITNNNADNTEYLLTKYRLRFDFVLTREKALWKPDPDPFWHVLREMGKTPAEALSIGDSLYDIKASQMVGIEKIFIFRSQQTKLETVPGIFYFSSFGELEKKVEHEVHVDMST